MKRFQRILLTAGLLVSLSGCDAISDPSSDIPEQIAVADSTTESSDAETAEAVTESERICKRIHQHTDHVAFRNCFHNRNHDHCSKCRCIGWRYWTDHFRMVGKGTGTV